MSPEDKSAKLARLSAEMAGFQLNAQCVQEACERLERTAATLSASIVKMADRSGAFRNEAGPLMRQLEADLNHSDPHIRELAEAEQNLTVNQILARARRALRAPLHDRRGAPIKIDQEMLSQVDEAVQAGSSPTSAARRVLGPSATKGQWDFLARRWRESRIK